jgi:AcrR family transcriptional regulator
MPKKETTPQDRREQILDAAEQVFAQKGFDKARMDDIVAVSGLSKGALYWYYKSKDALIKALLDRIFSGDLRAAESLAAAEGSAAERLQIFYRTSVEEIRRFEKLMPLGYEFLALAARRKTVRRVVGEYYHRFHAVLSELLRQGIEQGEFKRVPVEDMALAMVGMLEGIALLWVVDPDWIDWDRIGDLPLKMFIQSLEKEQGQRGRKRNGTG